MESEEHEITEIILVVDDEPANVDMLSRRLERRGYEVICAYSVAEAREIVNHEPVDLLLLDIMMPEVSGLEYLKELRDDHRSSTLPIILVSALGETDDVVKGLELGANDYVAKPINFPILLARMKTQLKLGAMMRKLETQQSTLWKMAVVDKLTNLYNRQMGDELLQKLYRQCSHSLQSFSIAMIDIDHFKQINDTHGHAIGDIVLSKVSKRLAEPIRSSDVLFRYGGEEFCLILPNTPKHRAHRFCEELRQRVESKTWEINGQTLSVTISIGIFSKIPDSDTQLKEWLTFADRALYEAKKAGRNQVLAYNDGSVPEFEMNNPIFD